MQPNTDGNNPSVFYFQKAEEYMPRTKGGHLYLYDLRYYTELPEATQHQKTDEFYRTLLSMVTFMPEVDNLHISIGMTRARTKFAVMLKVNDLQYGGYHESFDGAITEFIRKVDKFCRGGDDDFGKPVWWTIKPDSGSRGDPESEAQDRCSSGDQPGDGENIGSAI